MKIESNWIGKPFLELTLICLTLFLCLLCVILFPTFFQSGSKLSNWTWLILVLCVDVAHVYSSLYRTYFDKTQWLKHQKALIAIPIFAFILGFILWQLGLEVFWKTLAYIAVFHFIKQQYGFVKVYSRKQISKFDAILNTITIYTATLYPLIYWHCYGPFEFEWFVNNDFFYLNNAWIETFTRPIYFCIVLVYIFRVLYLLLTKRKFQLPLFLIITGTAISWYFSIIYFKSDLTFTFFNVLCHGIPYMTLVWIFGKKHADSQVKNHHKWFYYFFKKYSLPLFLFIPILFGFLEEGLWDGIFWNEHPYFFKPFYSFKKIITPQLTSLIIPILITPQLTHYVLDGFIWKVSKGHLES